jgi:hypothetical protein
MSPNATMSVVLGQAADDVAGHADGDARTDLGLGLVGGGPDRSDQRGTLRRGASLERGAHDDDLQMAGLGDEAVLVPLALGLLQLRLQLVGLVVGRRRLLVVEIDVERVRGQLGAADLLGERVTGAGEIGLVGVQEAVVPHEAPRDAVVGEDAGDEPVVDLQQTAAHGVGGARAQRRILRLDGDHHGAQVPDPLLELMQLDDRRSRRGQEVREVAVQWQAGGERTGADGDHQRHGEDGPATAVNPPRQAQGAIGTGQASRLHFCPAWPSCAARDRRRRPWR